MNTSTFCCYRRARVADNARKTFRSALLAVGGDIVFRLAWAFADGYMTSAEAWLIARLAFVGLLIVALNAAQTFWQLTEPQRSRRALARRARTRKP